MVDSLHLSNKRIGLYSITQEIKIIERAIQGDQSAYRLLYDSYVDNLYCFLAQFSENVVQQEEWTQRAFIKAFDKLNQFKSNSSFKTWLFTIGFNEMRTDMRQKIHFEDIQDHHLEHETEEDVQDSRIWNTAKSALKKLSPDKRVVCLLHIAESYSHAEIADMIGITEGASRIILHRAKKELKTLVST